MPMRAIAVKKALVTAVLVIVVGSLCTVAEAYTKSHIRAAEELLLVMEMPEMVSEMVDMVIESQFQQIPEMAQLEDVFRNFFAKHFSWERLRNHYIQIYVEAFTEQELREIIAFYQTETGKKLLRLGPELTSKSMILGQEIVIEHMPELEQMILEQL